jgi:hypothetical protein
LEPLLANIEKKYKHYFSDIFFPSGLAWRAIGEEGIFLAGALARAGSDLRARKKRMLFWTAFSLVDIEIARQRVGCARKGFALRREFGMGLVVSRRP